MSRALLLALLLATPALGQSVVKGELSRMAVTITTSGTVRGEYCGTATVYGGGSIFGGGSDGPEDDCWFDADFDELITLATSPDVTLIGDAASRHIPGPDDSTHAWFSNSGTAATMPHLSTVNGRGAILFDGTDDLITSNKAASWHNWETDGTQDWTWFLVIYQGAANPNSVEGLFGSSNGNSNVPGWYMYWDDRSGSSRDDTFVWGVGEDGGAAPRPFTYTAPNDTLTPASANTIMLMLEPGATGNDLTIEVNGASLTTIEPSDAYETADTYEPLQIGLDGGSNYGDFSLCAFIRIRRLLTSTERATVEQILSERWGTP